MTEKSVKPVLVVPTALFAQSCLGLFGKIPTALIPVEDKTALDFLIDRYDGLVSEIRLVAHDGIECLREALNASPYGEVKIVDLEFLSDLGHTVLEGLRYVNGPAIVNFADTLIDECAQLTTEIEKGSDVIVFSEGYATEEWTSFEEYNGRIINIEDKKGSGGWHNLFVGVFAISDAALFVKCLQADADGGIDSFYSALIRYSSVRPFKFLKSGNWLDLGHPNRYLEAKAEVQARSFNHIYIDYPRGILRKTSDDSKLIDEIGWYLKIPSTVEYCMPRIFSYSQSHESPYVEMEYYSYHTLNELFVYGNLNASKWYQIFERLRFIYRDFGRYTVTGEIQESLEEMYLKKTVSRLDMLREDSNFSRFFDSGVRVNGTHYLPLNEVTQIIKEQVPRLFDIDHFCISHGDMCFTNILIDDTMSFVKLIDPRGRFGRFDIYGDSRYDLAKLFHSVDGEYDMIIKDRFEVSYNPETISIMYRLEGCKPAFNLYEILLSVFKDDIGNQRENIEFIEALLFLSMIPLHTEKLDHQLVMLGKGLEILDRIVDVEAH